VAEKSADLLDVAVADQAVALGSRGLTKPWRQRFAGQCAAFPEIPCFGDPPACFGLGDSQPVGQRRAQCTAQLFLAGLCIELGLINACWGVRVLRAPRSRRSRARNRSGVVSTSKDNSHRRSRAASSTSKTAMISSRLLQPMPQILRRATDTNLQRVTTESKMAQEITKKPKEPTSSAQRLTRWPRRWPPVPIHDEKLPGRSGHGE
jgi:hypothetical protein